MTKRCIGVFSSIHFVLKAEKILKKKGITVVTLPVPRKISADCGIAISFLAEDLKEVRSLLAKKKVRLEGIYTTTEGGTYQVVE